MDLRERALLVQKISEHSIRFRLIEILIAGVFCIIALFNIDGVLVSIQPLSDQVTAAVIDFIHGDFRMLTVNFGAVFAVLVLFFFRWKYFGFKCGLLWFLFLLLNALFLIAVAKYKDVMPIFVTGVFFIAITSFFFIRSLFIKSIFPSILLAYTLSAWFLFLGVSNLAWFGFVSVFFADIFHLIFGLRYHISENAKKKKTLEAAIVHGVRKTIPASLLTIILLIVLDVVFYCLKMPMLISGSLPRSFAICICYVLWMPFFAAALLSFCPLESSCEKIQKKSK
jgi:hypothetical protein